MIRDLTLEITVAIAAAHSLEEAADSERGGSDDQRQPSVCEGGASATRRPVNTTSPPGLSVSREEESGRSGEGGENRRCTNLTLLAPNVYVLALCF